MPSKQVGIFIDFENLIYGLIDRYGEQGAYECFQVQRILDFAEKRGKVRWVWAYADWRIKAVNRFQSELYTRGVELIHVLGRGNKNAVDMKMACDMIEAHFTQKGVETFILCSGDRDFLPVLNTLRRHGKSLIALAPQRAMSRECKRLCNEVLTYESLMSQTISEPLPEVTGNLDQLKQEVISIVSSYHEDFMTGAQLKQLLTQNRKDHFDEKHYGFLKLGDLLAQFSDELNLVKPLQGDLKISLKKELVTDFPLQDQYAVNIALAALKGYQYQIDHTKRHLVLRTIFKLLHDEASHTWSETLPILCKELEISRSQANKYHAILLQSQAFKAHDDDDTSVKQRRMSLIDHIDTAEALIKRYEQSILLKIYARQPDISAELACQLLGFDLQAEHLAYAQKLLQSITTT
jgi:uncharacterized LabA/DUF88 family protein